MHCTLFFSLNIIILIFNNEMVHGIEYFSFSITEKINRNCLILYFTVPPKSNSWRYFIKSAEGGKCKLCQQTVKTAGNTTNLRFHLKRSHPDIADMQLRKENISREDVIEATAASKERKDMVV